jgi:hypothetical protein
MRNAADASCVSINVKKKFFPTAPERQAETARISRRPDFSPSAFAARFFRVRLDVGGNHLVAHARTRIRHAIPADGLLDFPRRGDAALLKLLFPIAEKVQLITAAPTALLARAFQPPTSARASAASAVLK